MPSSPTDYIRQTSPDRRPLLIWAGVAGVSLVIMGMIIGAPLAQACGHSGFAFAVYEVFSRLCHQIPERSFFIAGHQFAVCARCTGIYAGFTVGTLGYPLLRSLQSIDTPPRRWLFLAAVPLAIDFLLGFFGLWENTHLSRFLTGALLGSVSVFYVMPGLVDLSLKELRQLFTRKAVEIKS
ncbi:MAG: Protein of unknown function transrane [Acidobacteria bacterium]|nr:Protein of unknown function transrane [Acidobacteriota bacterium]